ncbi:hypothetical protein C1N32_16880 [Vibrio diazotrophicus]|uniref:Clp R domain-containing protein n=1 Tax=Vibrio diazotrophicus TaxID=685 RepID=A0A2J8HYC9_VIBDI|nr:hypothetical protein C1N32_16880 [Vibrio diazotrophicus]
MLDRILEDALNESFRKARIKRHAYLTVEHLLLAMLSTEEVVQACGYFSVDVKKLRSDLNLFIDQTTPLLDDEETQSSDKEKETQPTLSFQRVLQRSVFHVQASGRETVTPNNVVVAIFSEQESYAFELLKKNDLSRLDFVNYITNGINFDSDKFDESKFEDVFDETLDYRFLFTKTSTELKKVKEENIRLRASSEEEKELYENQLIELKNKIELLENKKFEDGLETIVRSVEFPPQYHIAGLNILSFFGAYLRERYPLEKAKVKIEQEDFIVRLVIETEQGHRDVIERALHEYEMVVVGQENPNHLPISAAFAHELSTELKMTKLRLEITQERLEMQNGRVDQLLTIIGNGLSANQSISVANNPIIKLTNTCNFQFSQTLPMVTGAIRELREAVGMDKESELRGELKAIDEAMQTLQGVNDATHISCSSGMNKLRRFLEALNDEHHGLAKSLKRIDNGITIAKDLCSKYNSIAEWCGLPQVPKVFTS